MVANVSISDDDLIAFCHKWRVAELSLFGSVLGGDFRADSDVDVLVDFAEGDSPSIESWLDMRDELEAMFARPVDLVEKQALDNPFRRRHILSNRKVMYAAG